MFEIDINLFVYIVNFKLLFVNSLCFYNIGFYLVSVKYFIEGLIKNICRIVDCYILKVLEII